MVVRKIYLGSEGPFLYDDAKPRADGTGMQGLASEGVPVEPTDVMRLADLGTLFAPQNAEYVVMSLNANLTAERRLQVGASLSLADGGANGDVTLDAIQDIRTSATPAFIGVKAKDGNGLNLFEDGGTKGLQVLNSGYVHVTDRLGVGVASPTNRIEVAGSGNTLVDVTDINDSYNLRTRIGHVDGYGGIFELYDDSNNKNVVIRSYGDSYMLGGNVGIGLVPTANMVGLSIEAGCLTLKERATPTANTNYGKIYTKTDNKIYFQDGAGAEHEMAYV